MGLLEVLLAPRTGGSSWVCKEFEATMERIRKPVKTSAPMRETFAERFVRFRLGPAIVLSALRSESRAGVFIVYKV